MAVIGCGCGKENVPDRKTEVVKDGVHHRYGLPCYEEHGSKRLGVLRHGAAVPEPAPAKTGGREVLPDLVRLLQERSDFGQRKYGVRLHTENGRDAYIDSLQELLDLFVYLHQAQMERQADLERLGLLSQNLKRRLKDQRALVGHAMLAGSTADLARRAARLDEVEFITKLLALVGEGEG